MIRAIRELLIRAAVRTERSRDRCIWFINAIQVKYFKENSVPLKTCHFLAVTNPIYVPALEVALNSFLAKNPGYKVKIHTDSLLRDDVKRLIYSSFFKSRIEVEFLGKVEDWREEKLNLIIAMCGTDDCYLDVDTRTNRLIPDSKGIIFFVDEGPVLEPWPTLDLSERKTFNMLNTTFFSWNGFTPPRKSEIHETFNMLRKTYNFSAKERLFEQMALSIFVQKNEYDYSALKKTDKQYDGGIIESSYLGTTGRHIYRR